MWSIHCIRQRNHPSSCNIDVLGSSQCVCAYPEHLYGAGLTNQRAERHFQLFWASHPVPFPSLSIPARRLSICSILARTATCSPIESKGVASRSFAHGGLSGFGRSCFRIALPQIICSRDGRKTSPAPIASVCSSNARRSSVVAQQRHSASSFPHVPRAASGMQNHRRFQQIC
jgi:hypothetical protein